LAEGISPTAQCQPGRGQTLSKDIRDWVEVWTNDLKPFVRHKIADEILERLGRYCANVINTDFIDGTA